MHRGSNAPRVKFPGTYFRNKSWDPTVDGKIDDAYQRLLLDLEVCRNLVGIAAGVLDKPLTVTFGGPRTGGIFYAHTDGTNIFIPKMHPYLRLVTKHELAHIYFDSNLAGRQAFVEALLDDWETRAGMLPVYLRNRLINDVSFVINIFEDIRVNSLWSLLFPGDGPDMDAMYFEDVGPRMKKKALEQHHNGQVTHLFTYIILRCLFQEVPSERWGILDELIDEARDAIPFQTFDNGLLIVRDLLEAIIELLVEWDNTKLDKALTLMESGPAPTQEFRDDNAGFDFHRSVPEKAREGVDEKAKALLEKPKLTDDDKADGIDEMASHTTELMEKILQLQTAQLTYDPKTRAQEKARARINFITVKPEEIRPVVLTPEELRIADRFKRHFRRVMAAVYTRPEESGYRIMADLYVQQRLSQQPLCCYARDITGRGFVMTVLVDMSYSMIYHFDQVERLAAVLRRSLDFPQVKLRFMGFNSVNAGEVQLFTFPDSAEGLISPNSHPGGVTPLPHAIAAAGSQMLGERGESHIFVISDGYPVYWSSEKRRLSQALLMENTREEVALLRRRRVQTWCFMSGSATPGAENMTRMFGPGHWRKISEDKIYQDSLEFVTKKFLNYVRKR